MLSGRFECLKLSVWQQQGDEAHQAVEHRLMQDIDNQSLAAHKGEKPAVLLVEGGGEAAFLDIDPHKGTHKEEEKPGQQGKIIGGVKPGGDKAEGE